MLEFFPIEDAEEHRGKAKLEEGKTKHFPIFVVLTVSSVVKKLALVKTRPGRPEPQELESLPVLKPSLGFIRVIRGKAFGFAVAFRFCPARPLIYTRMFCFERGP